MADSENRRYVDRIRAITFKEAKDEGALFITRQWVANRLQRSETFVKDNWNRNPYNCSMEKEHIGKGGTVMNEHEKRICRLSGGTQGNSIRKVTKRIVTARGDEARQIHHTTVHRYMKSIKMIPFHVIRKPLKTEQNKEDRLWFCDFLANWGEDDFLHVACSDEFYVYLMRKPNHQNDRVWATSLDEIEDYERYRSTVAHPTCIGMFICFTARKMMFIIKENGESWTGEYFRNTILNSLIPFLHDPENVVDVNQVTLLHDKAPCFKALQTQQMLRNANVDFFDNTQWPGNSPDLNPCEHLGAIIKQRVEANIHVQRDPLCAATLMNHLQNVLVTLQNDTGLFECLLKSFPARLAAVQEARGGHTRY